MVGSDLTPDPNSAGQCASVSATCTTANIALPGHQLTAPIVGVVVRWRVRAANGLNTIDIALRVLRPAGGGAYTGISTSGVQTFPITGLTTITYPTRQAIRSGDLIGLNVGVGSGNLLIQGTNQAGVTAARWEPPLADGATLPPIFTATNPSTPSRARCRWRRVWRRDPGRLSRSEG